jgi:anti-sigma-K factor RskA
MSTEQGHERYEDELAAWVLGALDADEAAAFERHLARCEQCRTDLNWLRPAVDAIPASVTQVAPPPRLRGTLLATVRSEARRSKRERSGSALASWIPFPRPALAALGAAALIGAGVAGYALRGGDESSTIGVQASGPAQGATAELVVEGDSGTLHAEDMPPLRGDHVFQAWIQEQGEDRLRPSTVFVAERDGTAAATMVGLEDAEQVMVTREPNGGSTEPTTSPMLRATL